MKRISILDEAPDLPLQLGPSAVMAGDIKAVLPAGLLEFYQSAPACHLLAWNDTDSATMGLSRSGSLIVFEPARLLELTINILRRAKGAGWISFEAVLTDQDQPLVLLEAVTFNEAGLAWLEARTAVFEAVFGVKSTLIEHGYDC
ncbi:hypothetical protein [Undibacterium sp. Tian12W]|uniref:hypothetical protein n=1 Tax=Undibacterium sp. Tian12W TaxID=3413054 RepID=UPI003BF1A77B